MDLERTVLDPETTTDAQGLVFRSGGQVGYLDLTTGGANEGFLATEADTPCGLATDESCFTGAAAAG